jgi:Uncharacterized anaerobic dehydrogenase
MYGTYSKQCLLYCTVQHIAMIFCLSTSDPHHTTSFCMLGRLWHFFVFHTYTLVSVCVSLSSPIHCMDDVSHCIVHIIYTLKGPKENDNVTLNGKKVKAVVGQKVSVVAAQNRVKINYNCRNGDCGTCMIKMNGRNVKACQMSIPAGKCNIETL